MPQEIRYPEWREGVRWVLAVRQLAIWTRVTPPPWVGPMRLAFEVLGQDAGTYRLRATVLDRGNGGEEWAEMRLAARDRDFVDGVLHINGHEVAMDHDVLARLLRAHPARYDLSGEPSEATIHVPRERPITVRVYSTVTENGATRLSSPDLPYHLRIIEPTYTADLESWQ
jgi:hypothetical protein